MIRHAREFRKETWATVRSLRTPTRICSRQPLKPGIRPASSWAACQAALLSAGSALQGSIHAGMSGSPPTLGLHQGHMRSEKHLRWRRLASTATPSAATAATPTLSPMPMASAPPRPLAARTIMERRSLAMLRRRREGGVDSECCLLLAGSASLSRPADATSPGQHTSCAATVAALGVTQCNSSQPRPQLPRCPGANKWSENLRCSQLKSQEHVRANGHRSCDFACFFELIWGREHTPLKQCLVSTPANC